MIEVKLVAPVDRRQSPFVPVMRFNAVSATEQFEIHAGEKDGIANHWALQSFYCKINTSAEVGNRTCKVYTRSDNPDDTATPFYVITEAIAASTEYKFAVNGTVGFTNGTSGHDDDCVIYKDSVILTHPQDRFIIRMIDYLTGDSFIFKAIFRYLNWELGMSESQSDRNGGNGGGRSPYF